MDQRRLYLAVAISIAIIFVAQMLQPRRAHPPAPVLTEQQVQAGQSAPTAPKPSDTLGVVPQDSGQAPVPPPREVPRVKIAALRVQGSISLLGARIDDLVLRDYRETLKPDSALVRLLEPRGDPQPNYAQFGWEGAGIKLPDNDHTVWTSSADTLSPGHPVTLTWDNGVGQVFSLAIAIDDNYLFTIEQRVRNTGAAPVVVAPWSRIRREYTPQTAGFFVLHEGLTGMLDGKLTEKKYADVKSDAEKDEHLTALKVTTTGGWAGITDKYFLAALAPDQAKPSVASYSRTKGIDGYQVGFTPPESATVAPGAETATTTRLFAGAREVHLVDRYENEGLIANFSYAIDWGWLKFLTKPFFFAIDWLYGVLGNFGLAIMAFTVLLKTLFFPLANRSYRSMNKMKLLGPRMTALREQFKDEPAKLQTAMMQLYKAEKVNPVSGCLPMLLQIPVFWALYKVIFINIEMRQAPFFGWIHDLSAVDPTNVFNLFGLIPYDPTQALGVLHLSAWAMILGVTMVLQQRMSPPPPDPTQAKLFKYMPLLFMFFMAGLPAGLVIYYSWNNLLTVLQQWVLLRQARLAQPSLARS